MSENIRGQVSLDTGDRTYTLQYTTNALCRFEELTGMAPEEIAKQSKGGRILARALVWAGLLESHPETSLDDAGRIIDVIGMQTATALAAKAFLESQSVTKRSNGAANPRKAVRHGIGADS